MMMEKQNQYAYSLCIQLTMPEEPYEADFHKTLKLLQEKGFYGVELNITDFSRITPQRLRSMLEAYNLKLTMIASGGYAQKHQLSISHPMEDSRIKSVEALKMMLEFASDIDAGVICGFMKGGAAGDSQICGQQLKRSLSDLNSSGVLKKNSLYLEATNHYEALLVNTLDDGYSFVRQMDGQIGILPDTYHMNIEESNMIAALIQYQHLYQNIHISDNNRYYPGFGSISFVDLFRVMKSIGYEGTISIEGRNKGSLREDISKSSDYLYAVSKQLSM